MEIHDYFTYYSSKEQKIVNEWLNNTTWLKGLVLKAEAVNTGFHDAKVTLTNGISFIVEVKEDEIYWYSKTGNVGLDYLSAFNFNINKEKYTTQCKNWITPENLQDFLNSISVSKWGKLKTCDADIQLFYVKNEFFIAYNNCLLQQNIAYFEQNYKLRINNKKNYGITDNWESASYFVKPVDFQNYSADKTLVSCEVNNITDLQKAITMAIQKYPTR